MKQTSAHPLTNFSRTGLSTMLRNLDCEMDFHRARIPARRAHDTFCGQITGSGGWVRASRYEERSGNVNSTESPASQKRKAGDGTRKRSTGIRRPRAWLLALVLSAAVGCQPPAAAPSKTAGKSQTDGTAARKQEDSHCEYIITNVLAVFQLKSLDLSPALVDGVARLNDWQRSCAQAVPANMTIPDRARKLLTKSQLDAILDRHFVPRDGDHLRDCVVLKAIAKSAVGTADNDLDRTTNLFQYVVRGIGLLEKHPQDLPLTAYEIFLLGRGTVEDRSWMFVSLLRQLKIDAVILRPGTNEAEKGTDERTGKLQPFLVGVILDENVYLFDPRAGVPIPGPSGKSVATLAQAASIPDVLRQLDANADYPYPITSLQLQHPVVELVGDSTLWSGRMPGLQAVLTGDRALTLSDPLGDVGENPGLWSRITQAGGTFWSEEALTVWGYPESQLQAHAELTKEQVELREGVLAPFRAYKVVSQNRKTGAIIFADHEEVRDKAAGQFDPGKRVNVRTTSGTQLASRLRQFEGDFPGAISGFLLVERNAKIVRAYNPPKDLEISHRQAIDDAIMFIGLCQWEQGGANRKTAVKTLLRSAKVFPEGRWARHRRNLLAQCQAAIGEFDAAIATLDDIEADDPEYFGCRLLIRQWQADAARSANGK